MNNIENNITRRKFVKLTGLLGAALAVGYYIPALGSEPLLINAEEASHLGIDLNAWISIDSAGKVTIINHRSEMGQGSFQSVPQIIAEELEVNLNDINILFAPGNHKKYGDQTTGGSSTIRGSYKMLLSLGAAARMMLIQSAATKWGVTTNECFAENGHVLHRSSQRKFNYGTLVLDASKLDAPKDVQLKDVKDYKLIRQPLLRQDIPNKTNGQTIFGLDKKIPGMLYAVVERSSRFAGTVQSIDDSATKLVAGVKHVFKIEVDIFGSKRQGVAVVAENLWSAMEGRKALKVTWDDSQFEHQSSKQLYEKMQEMLKEEANISKAKGDFNIAYKASNKKIKAVYQTPYQAHSCMEPLNFIAHYQNNKIELWGPTQQPDSVQNTVSEKLGIDLENVIVKMTFLGGGFGRKAFDDFPMEAALISKEINAPVQVVWTREDDTSTGPFRPGMTYQLKAGLNSDGNIAAFETKMTGQNMDLQNKGANKSKSNHSLGEGLPKHYLEVIPHYSFGDKHMESPIPVMWWRSVYSSTNAFAYESFLDEVAHAAEKDPLDFRQAMLPDARFNEVISTLKEISGWNNKGKKSGYGVALTECFQTIVGQVVKVSKKADGKIKIDKVWVVMDCGWYVNPDIIRAQIEGSVVMALGAATKHEILFEDGKAVHQNFDTYAMPRINDIPEIEISIINNFENAGGVGEPALPAFAPALTNAIFDLTGKRIRKLPFNIDEV